MDYNGKLLKKLSEKIFLKIFKKILHFGRLRRYYNSVIIILKKGLVKNEKNYCGFLGYDDF